MAWADVDFCYHKEHRHLEGKRHPQMLLAHADNACTDASWSLRPHERCMRLPDHAGNVCGMLDAISIERHAGFGIGSTPRMTVDSLGRLTSIGPNYEACIVRQVACQAIGSCLEVSLMSCKVHQGDYLTGACNVVSTGVGSEEGVIEDTALGVQLHAHISTQLQALHQY